MRKIIKSFLILLLFIPFIVNAEKCTLTSDEGIQIGSEMVCGTEHFYVIDSNETDIQALAKYNLNVGDKIDYFDVNEDTRYNTFEYDLMENRCKELALEKGYNPYFIYSIESSEYNPDEHNYYYYINGCRIYERINPEYVRQDERAIGTKLDGNGKSILPIYGITYMVPSWGYEAQVEGSTYVNEYDENGNIKIYGSSFEKYFDDYKNELLSQNVTVKEVSFPTLGKIEKLLEKISDKDFEVNLEFNENLTLENGQEQYELYIGKMDIKDYIPSNFNWVYSVTYWLGSGFANDVEHLHDFPFHGTEFNDYYITNEGVLCSLGRGECSYFDYPIGNGVRPLITIAKANVIDPSVIEDNPVDNSKENVIESYIIETETDGNGEVDVVSKAQADEVINIKITPKENYKVKSIIIYDKVGNGIEYSEDQLVKNEDGSFTISSYTMPHNDIRIVVKFETELAAAIKEELVNPKTGVFSPLYIFFATLFISGIAYVILLRKSIADIRM